MQKPPQPLPGLFVCPRTTHVKTLAALLLTLSLTTPAIARAPTLFERSAQAVVTVSFRSHIDNCGGVAQSKNTVRTAFHCVGFSPWPGRAFFNGSLQDYTVDELWAKDDQVVLRVEGMTFKHTAKFGKSPKPGDRVFVWGNPAGYSDLLRIGHFMGPIKNTQNWKEGPVAYAYDFNGFKGDSGHPIFNMKGEVVGIVSQKISEEYRDENDPRVYMMYDMMISYETRKP